MAEAQTILYIDLPASSVSDDDLQQSAALFSNHYGVWAQSGNRVKMSPQKLKEQLLFDSETCSVMQAWAKCNGEKFLVGHAFVCRFEIPDKGNALWITQMIVHSQWRGRGIAKRLCRMAWGTRMYFASGLVSSHPYAVSALEGATERRCQRDRIVEHAQKLIDYSKIPYVQEKTLCFEAGKCLIDTQFTVDHKEVDNILLGIAEWKLGPLENGKEFFAFTFADAPKSLPHTSPTRNT